MPIKAPRICSCGKVVTSGAVCECEARRNRERKERFDKKRPTARQRGYTAEWEREAKAFLSEPGNRRCARCGDPATVVMHIKSIRARPDLRMVRSNWRPGCQRCNAKEAAQERQERKPS